MKRVVLGSILCVATAIPAGADTYTRNVTAFGAVCDGVTDDSAAFARAHNAFGVYGGTLNLPEGVCLLASGWIITKPLTVVGQGTGTLLLSRSEAAPTVTVRTMGPDDGVNNPVNQKPLWILRNLSIGGTSASSTARGVLLIDRAHYGAIENVLVFGGGSGRAKVYIDSTVHLDAKGLFAIGPVHALPYKWLGIRGNPSNDNIGVRIHASTAINLWAPTIRGNGNQGIRASESQVFVFGGVIEANGQESGSWGIEMGDDQQSQLVISGTHFEVNGAETDQQNETKHIWLRGTTGSTVTGCLFGDGTAVKTTGTSLNPSIIANKMGGGVDIGRDTKGAMILNNTMAMGAFGTLVNHGQQGILMGNFSPGVGESGTFLSSEMRLPNGRLWVDTTVAVDQGDVAINGAFKKANSMGIAQRLISLDGSDRLVLDADGKPLNISNGDTRPSSRLPGNPAGYLKVIIEGVERLIPYW